MYRAWNKNLTKETDIRVAIVSKKIAQTVRLKLEKIGSRLGYCIKKYKNKFCKKCKIKIEPHNKSGYCIYCLRKTKTYRQKMSKALKGKTGGLRIGGGHSKGKWYNSSIAGRVYLDSSFEIAFAKFLDFYSIRWIRCYDKFFYRYRNKAYNYIPDFYLIDTDEYVEIKGFETERDKAKWKYFSKRLIVLFEKDLLQLGVFNAVVA